MKLNYGIASEFSVIVCSCLLAVPSGVLSQTESEKSASSVISTPVINTIEPPTIAETNITIPPLPEPKTVSTATIPTAEKEAVPANNPAAIPNYDTIIQNSLKERARRLGLLSEALTRLRDAGEISIARRVEVRILALVEMPDAAQTDAVFEQMGDLVHANETLKAEIKELNSIAEKAKPTPTEEIKATSIRRSR